ncbi:MAG: aspartate aminotransferase family protein, partial [Hyphomicrobium sp.]|nr:aspartate aminotransferase family protein [Hyphomicrobium sp.]
MRKSLPAKGRSRDAILAEMRDMRGGDADWQGGRVPLFVFKANDEVSEVGKEAFFEFFTENALGGRRAFPSVKRMEDELIAMALSLFNAPDDAQGFMTTGGTESIVQAVQTCRDWTRKQRKIPTFRGNIVAAESVHPAFNKGAGLMDLDVRRAPVCADLAADPAAIEALIDDDTMMIVGSAPSFPYGVIDPIRELGALAERRGLWLHVDACVGGYLAPFVKMLGRNIPDFDFSVPGVSSLSADLHKFGFTPKPASTVFYRPPEKAAHHGFDFDPWPNGRFLTSTLVGTRPAGGV